MNRWKTKDIDEPAAVASVKYYLHHIGKLDIKSKIMHISGKFIVFIPSRPDTLSIFSIHMLCVSGIPKNFLRAFKMLNFIVQTSQIIFAFLNPGNISHFRTISWVKFTSNLLPLINTS
jgi:hypothetical protein